jgi:FkbM family methyltransferase
MEHLSKLRYRARVRLGALLHGLGLYRRLLPVYQPHPKEFARRLQAYLNHFYEQVRHAEAELYLAELGTTFACDIKDHMLWGYLHGEATIYEHLEINHCRKLVRSQDHIVDIGANHGFWGFALAQMAGPAAKLYLAEANPVVLQRLRRTAQLNPQIHATILPYAITDGSDERVTFYLPEGNLSGLGSTVLHSHAAVQGWLKDDHRITVSAKSLDALVEDGAIEGIDVIKIDVEHGEDAVLRGGLLALDRFRPRLVMMETSVESWAASTLIQRGYQIYRLDNVGDRMSVEKGFWGNLVFTSPPRA